MIPALSLRTFRWIFVGTILISSLQTLVESPSLSVSLLASVETVAILAFASERRRVAGAAILLGVFAVAFVASALNGEFAARFLYFAASAIFLTGRTPAATRWSPRPNE